MIYTVSQVDEFGLDSLTVTDEMDDTDDVWHLDFAGNTPLCDFDIGDSDGFCIRDLYGCHVVGCEYAQSNE